MSEGGINAVSPPYDGPEDCNTRQNINLTLWI
jgi:hypothetical protein